MMPCGLPNLGNTCYMNTLLQCLSGCPSFIEYVQRLKLAVNFDQELNDDDKEDNKDLVELLIEAVIEVS